MYTENEWKKRILEFFVVRLSHDGRNSMTCRIPKPILDMLGEPDGIKFIIQGNRIVITTS